MRTNDYTSQTLLVTNDVSVALSVEVLDH